jgi:hypothetical protein
VGNRAERLAGEGTPIERVEREEGPGLQVETEDPYILANLKG